MHLLEVAEGMLRVGMEHDSVVAQQPVWPKGNFLKIRHLHRIDKVNILPAKSFYLSIARMLGPQASVGERRSVGVVESPDIGIGRHIEYSLERQRQATAMVVGSPRIAPAGIGNEASHSAAAACHIPSAAREALGEHRRTTGLTSGKAIAQGDSRHVRPPRKRESACWELPRAGHRNASTRHGPAATFPYSRHIR